jgi:hypothetical protein
MRAIAMGTTTTWTADARVADPVKPALDAPEPVPPPRVSASFPRPDGFDHGPAPVDAATPGVVPDEDAPAQPDAEQLDRSPTPRRQEYGTARLVDPADVVRGRAAPEDLAALWRREREGR